MTDRDEIARTWTARGYSCDEWVDPPKQRWEDFVHDTDELVLVIEGAVEFEIGGQVHRPSPGAELLIPAGIRHSVRNIGPTVARWLYGYRRG